MTVVRVKGFQIFKDRHGKLRCYHRATKSAIDLEKTPIGSVEFLAECAAIGNKGKANKPKTGTLAGLIERYRSDDQFQNLSDVTKKGYQSVFDWLKPISDTPLARFDRPMVVKIRDKAKAKRGWSFANLTKLVLSVIFQWGSERGHVPFNYAAQIRAIPRPTDLEDMHRAWTEQEQEVVLDACSPHMKPVIGLMLYMGLGPGDAIKLPRSRLKDWKIEYRRGKTGQPYFWPLPEELVTILKQAPPHNAITIVASSRGQPWTRDGFNTVWQRLKEKLVEAELIGSDLTLYGLRHGQAEFLAELGFDPRTIADALGQATESMALRYSKKAKLGKKMHQVVEMSDAARAKKRTRFVKPDEENCQIAEVRTKGDREG